MNFPLQMSTYDTHLFLYNSPNYIAKSDLVDGGFYIICARNAYIGLWLTAKNGFVIPRCKGCWYLFTETHWDEKYYDEDGVIYNRGTAKPFKLVANSLDNNDEGLLDFLIQCEKDNPIVEGVDSVANRQKSNDRWLERLSGKGLVNNNKISTHKVKRKNICQ